MYKRLLHIVFLCSLLFSLAGKSQTYPVQAFLQVSPPYSSYLPDYADPFSNQMKVLLTLTDFSVPSYQVKLRFKIEGSGYTMQNTDLVSLPSFTLTPGIPVEISGALLAPYLHTSNLAITGFDIGAYERNKILPEGPATICVEIVNFSGVDQALLANSTCAQTWFSLYEPPLLNLPFCGTEINATDPQGVLFSWTPLHMASPFAGETTYLFELFEIRPDGSDPNLVVNSSLPIYTESTNFTFINYGIMQPPLQVGMTYVWRVKARDPSGRELYRNNGYTAVCTFTYGSIAGSIIGDYTMEIESNGTGVRQGLAWWNASDLFTSYHLEVRKTGNPAYEWFPYSIETGQYKINSLEPLTEYECRVKGMAGEASTPWSNTSVFTTQANPNYTCGTTALPGRAASIVPLKSLIPGNIVALGQFEMRVIFAEETGIPGEFSGAGRIEIPFMLVSMNATFDRILIDEDMVMRAGRVDIISEGMDDWLPEETEFYIEGIVDRVEFNDEDSTFTLYFGDEERTFEFEFDGPITVYDEAGYVYTLNRDGTYTRVMGGTHDNDVLDATANYQIIFEPSEDQTYGFDEFTYANWSDNYPFITLRDSSIYRPPYKAMGSRNSDEIIAKIRSIDPIEAPYFETSLGEALTSHQINDTAYRVELGEYVVTKDLYAFDSEGAKIGKAYLPIYASYVRKLKIVPVNGATPPVDIQSQINTIFRQTNRAFEVDIASNYDYEFDLNDNGLDAPEGELMSRYSNEMRVLRDAYFEDSTQANRTYYIFVVPSFNDDSKGYMVRGKAVGFIAEGESARTYAHELGHGAFGLRHTFDEVPQGTTNNLMDYGEGVHLTHAQWDEIQSFSPVFSILDDDEDGAYEDISELLTFYQKQETYVAIPAGHAVPLLDKTTLIINGIDSSIFDIHGKVYKFKKDGIEYEPFFGKALDGSLYYSGYYTSEQMDTLNSYPENSDEKHNKMVEIRFDDFSSISSTTPIYTKAPKNQFGTPSDCYCDQFWTVDDRVSASTYNSYPHWAYANSIDGRLNREVDIEYENCTGVCIDYDQYDIAGPAERIFVDLADEYPDDLENLTLLTQYLNTKIDASETFAFFADEPDGVGNSVYKSIHHLEIKSNLLSLFLIKKEVTTVAQFEEIFGSDLMSSTRNAEVIFSVKNLWEGIDKSTYNTNSIDSYLYKSQGVVVPYEYSLNDLIRRDASKKLNSILYKGILDLENLGLAEPIDIGEYHEQLYAKYGSDAAILGLVESAAVFSQLFCIDLAEYGEELAASLNALEKATQIHEKYYNPLLGDAYYSGFYDLFSFIDMSSFFIGDDQSLKNFAFLCGIYNGLLNELTEVTKLIPLMAEAICNPEVFEGIVEAISNIDFNSIATMVQNDFEGLNPYQESEMLGRYTVTIMSILVPITKAKWLTKFKKAGNLIRDLSASLKKFTTDIKYGNLAKLEFQAFGSNNKIIEVSSGTEIATILDDDYGTLLLNPDRITTDYTPDQIIVEYDAIFYKTTDDVEIKNGKLAIVELDDGSVRVGVIRGDPDWMKNLSLVSRKELEDYFDLIKNDPPFELKSNTPTHKAQRWEQYKLEKGEDAWEFTRWSNLYDLNMTRTLKSHQGVNDYHSALGWGEREVTISIGGKTRRLDIADVISEKGIEIKEYSTGKVYNTTDIRNEVLLDKLLVEDGWIIEWVFKGCQPSRPLDIALVDANITIKLID